MTRFAPLVAPVALALLLASCAPAAPTADTTSDSSASWPANEVEVMNLELQKNVTTDDQGVVTTEAALMFDGKLTPLGTVTGELNPVARQLGQDPSIIAVFTAWFAGGGEEVRVTRSEDRAALVIEKRSGDESGACTDWERVGEIAISPDQEAQLMAEAGTEVPASSLAFCDK